MLIAVESTQNLTWGWPDGFLISAPLTHFSSWFAKWNCLYRPIEDASL